MLRAVWNGTVIAEAAHTVVVEGNHYVPPESLHREYFTRSPAMSLCPWKGIASYYTVRVGDEVNPNAAWYYPHPSPFARKIRTTSRSGTPVAVVGVMESVEGSGAGV
ncbi:DUF427 domain-containing protein [Streptomyces sp. So13.3]|uniref:DUF427 domain-containing protein n=1 Tax=Streptomyces TaxID=1883 RepID=UPI001106FBBF|nr:MULTISPECIES: DUF427 domain-containing protein [Streptomyces]MCZ4102849.1 DUF427 domain-containing protein [Streptomyces sp. H39-C1]NEA77155.1 DUF427 domain-containing protein [Streptomyces sp. SID13588]QNA76221.1 DUF427 domain-containing protein [Streptomyces sp. So13.3]